MAILTKTVASSSFSLNRFNFSLRKLYLKLTKCVTKVTKVILMGLFGYPYNNDFVISRIALII